MILSLWMRQKASISTAADDPAIIIGWRDPVFRQCAPGWRCRQSRYAVERRDRTIHARMREYLYTLKHMEELETSIIPIGDGAAISVKIEIEKERVGK